MFFSLDRIFYLFITIKIYFISMFSFATKTTTTKTCCKYIIFTGTAAGATCSIVVESIHIIHLLSIDYNQTRTHNDDTINPKRTTK